MYYAGDDEKRFGHDDSDELEAVDGELELASRWARLGAAILDSIILIIALIIIMVAWVFAVYAGTQFDPDQLAKDIEDAGMMFALVMSVLTITVFLLLNGYLIYTRQQTIGKLAVGIRVVADDGSPITGNRYFLIRYLPLYIITQLPVGGLIGLVNAVFIFRANKKCLHDDFAGTKVIKVPT